MIIDETTFSILNTLRKTSDHALRALCIVVVTSEVGFRFEYHLFLEKKFVSKVPPDIKHIFLLYFSIFQNDRRGLSTVVSQKVGGSVLD